MRNRNRQKAKRWFIVYSSLSLFMFIIVGAVNYIVDPYQQYRKAGFYKPIFDPGNQRYINPGIAKNYDYESVIIGTSMTENMDLREVEKKLKKRAVNLSASGASAYEESLILQVALKTGRVKSVLWCLDFYSFQGNPGRFRFGESSMPLYLYDDTIFNDYRYLINRITFRKALDCVFMGDKFNRDINRPYYWADKVTYGGKEALEEWRQLLANKTAGKNVLKEDRTLAVLKTSFERNMLPHVKNNPHIAFVIYFPPYSLLTWAYMREQGTINDVLDFKKYVVDSLTGFRNVDIYDFQHLESITANMENYKDISHYSPQVDDFILDSIAERKHRVNSLGIGDNIRSIKRQALAYEGYAGR